MDEGPTDREASRRRFLLASTGMAMEAVARLWSPPGPLLALLVAELRAHGIDFEPR